MNGQYTPSVASSLPFLPQRPLWIGHPPFFRFGHSRPLCLPLLPRVFVQSFCYLLTLVSNSTFRLVIRFIFQVNFLSPKSPISAFASVDLPVQRATLLLFGTFFLGFLSHLLFSVPSAGEPTQGYLHGGLLIDFIGQRILAIFL